jgi:putative PIN family toxin of toxin-antitoxin system
MIDRRVVLDTNVIISSLLKPRSLPRRVLDKVLQHRSLLFSDETALELHRRLLSSKFNPYVTLENRLSFLRLLPTLASYVTVTTTISACRDPKDNKFLALAVDGNGHYIITGDKDLLVLNPFQGVEILTHKEFLDLSFTGS